MTFDANLIEGFKIGLAVGVVACLIVVIGCVVGIIYGKKMR